MSACDLLLGGASIQADSEISAVRLHLMLVDA
jgi:hypothetical protein